MVERTSFKTPNYMTPEQFQKELSKAAPANRAAYAVFLQTPPEERERKQKEAFKESVFAAINKPLAKGSVAPKNKGFGVWMPDEDGDGDGTDIANDMDATDLDMEA